LLDRADGLVDSQMGPFLTETNCCLTPHFHSRKLLQKLLPWAFPYQFIDVEGRNTFARMEENWRKGRATIVCVTHFDKGEVPAAIGMIVDHLSDEYLASGVKIVIPASYHQKTMVGPLGWFGNIDMCFVVNQDTIDLKKSRKGKRKTIFSRLLQKEEEELKLGDGVEEYLEELADAVRKGGTGYIAIQGGRRDHLGEPGIVLSLLLNHLERNGLTNYDILFIGSGLKDPVWQVGDWKIGESIPQTKSWIPVESYVGRNGFNRRCLHVFRAGPLVSREELMEILDRYHAAFGEGKKSKYARLRQADRWAFDMIREHGLVDAAYLQDHV